MKVRFEKLVAAAMAICFVLLSTSVFAQERNETADSKDDNVQYVSTVKPYPIECITPPEGFQTPDGFQGYVHWTTQASILVAFVQGRTIADAEASLNDEYFAANQIDFVSKESVVTDSGEEALLYKFSSEGDHGKWYRYGLFIGDVNGVLWITASYPQKSEEAMKDEIRKSLMTTKLMSDEK